MKKSIKNIIAVVLMVPVLTMGLLVVLPIGAQALEVRTAHDKETEITTSTDSRCNLYAVTDYTMAEAAACNNKAGGTSCLFGKDATTNKDCVLNTVINFALYFIGSISVLMLIIGGVRYTMSAGNEKAVGAAKSTILYAVIGVVVALLAYAIVNFVLGTFRA